MKRFISIGLLSLLLYNTVGYYAFFMFRQRQAREHVRTLLDKTPSLHQSSTAVGGVQQGNWVVFRIPLQLYHQIDRQPIPVEGEFKYQGKIYEKALLGIENDTVLLYCVNNKRQEQVQQQRSDHAKALAADFPDNQAGKSQKLLNPFVKEYLSIASCGLTPPVFVLASPSAHPLYHATACSLALPIPTPPPRLHLS